ncbi:MAG: RNA polymerase sigma factor [Clostridia bacterium]|nr:RNA polymerase sigma factor [Clostridia bacterium]
MTEKERVLHVFETEMIPKIYGFCRLKMSTSEDAEDLAQEICLSVLRAIQQGKTIENLNAFVWSVSNHLFYNALRRKKRHTTVYLPDYLSDGVNVEDDYIRQEEIFLLRRELAHMTGNYRQAVILHYFEEKSCEEIAEALGRSVGTVKWWLHDARNAIKKGMNLMREYGEKSYRPGRMLMSCTGLPGANSEPMCCAARKSAQNILLAAYQKPVSIEELCMELGISAPYIEDEVEYLKENQLLRETAGGKYQTDFVILPGDNPAIADKIREAVFPDYYKQLTAFLEERRELLTGAPLNPCSFSWERLLWVYIHMITVIALEAFKYSHSIHIKYADIPLRPNGGKWIAYGYENDPSVPRPQWKAYHPYDGPIHKVDGVFAEGFFHTWSGTDDSPYFETPDAVFALSGRIARGECSVDGLSEEEKYLFSIALEKKLFIKTADGYRPTFHTVGREAFATLNDLAVEFGRQVEDIFLRVKQLVWAHCAPFVPKHLEGQMGNLLSNHFYSLIPCSYAEAVDTGDLTPPEGEGRLWISLLVSEG